MMSVLGLSIGVVVALLYTVLHYSTESISEWRIETMMEMMEADGGPGRAFGFTAGVTIAIALFGGLCVMIEPSAAGSGMPEVMAYLNGSKAKKYISFRTLVNAGFAYLLTRVAVETRWSHCNRVGGIV